MEAYKAILATLDDSKPEHDVVLTKVDADSIKLAFGDLGCGKELERTAGPGSSSANSAVAGGLISRLLTLRLTQFSGRDQDCLSFINMFDGLVDLRTDLMADQKFAYLLSCLLAEPRDSVKHLTSAMTPTQSRGIY
ncbi:hypothetical protein EVAR_8830_1 [Eumeta japonica]|uniref:Uncharacterized protein n=1 Tax=Eumeta variegata TaxID=151549 RepID=A0A4C1TTZ3_EUMVA|nr:hypothetical protein EVAR_8830_1 [Eumeta japonica]